MKKVIIDTDIGTDVDDAIALTLCLKSKNLNLKAITTTVYDSKRRAMIAKKLTKSLNQEIPVAFGHEYDKKWYIGYEGNGLLDEKDDFKFEKNPINLISSMIKKHLDISLVCIGPLGNIADVINAGSKVNHIYFMGGAIESDGKFIPTMDSHNIELDFKSAETVFNSNIPISIVTKEVSKKVYLTKEDFENIKKLNTPWSDYIHQHSIDWLNISQKGVSYMYDPLTVAMAEDKSLFKTKKLGNIEISTDIDVQRFKQYLFKNLEVEK